MYAWQWFITTIGMVHNLWDWRGITVLRLHGEGEEKVKGMIWGDIKVEQCRSLRICCSACPALSCKTKKVFLTANISNQSNLLLKKGREAMSIIQLSSPLLRVLLNVAI